MCSSADERLVIEHYFETGLRYDTIVQFLCEYQEIYMNRKDFEKRASSIWAFVHLPLSVRSFDLFCRFACVYAAGL